LNTQTTWAALLAAATLLPDRRLNTRLRNILDELANQPTVSIPQAAGNWGQAKASYRFLSNDRVTQPALTDGFARDTARLCQEQPVVLVVQDTTSLNLTANKSIAELGPIESKSLARGLFMHTTLAMTEQGVLIGVLGQQFWTRPQRGQPGSDEKESAKWIYGIDQARQPIYEAGDCRPCLVHIFDREGDIYDVMLTIDDLDDRAIIRCAQDRRLEHSLQTAHAAVRAQPIMDRKWLKIPRSHGCANREAYVEVRVLSATLMPDLQKYPHAWSMTWTLVEVWESDPPAGVTPLHWLLWTREPAATPDEAWEVVRKYTCRWPIEEFHLTFKSGCRIEDLQLETWDRLTKALVLYSVVSARIVSLRDLSRAVPEAPATVLLSEEECTVLLTHFGRGKSLDNLTLGQAVLWIGRLGGHLNRKGDGMPGVRTLWRGMRDLSLLVRGYRSAKRVLE
jgi:hypothetical protein